MKSRLLHLLLVTLQCFVACKKSNYSNPADTISTEIPVGGDIVYKTHAVIASPNDSLHQLFDNSIIVNHNTAAGNISAYILNNLNGFSFGYVDPTKSLPYFMFSSPAFPGVPRHFTLNKLYEHQPPRGDGYRDGIFLGTPDAFTGMTYFVNNQYPPDATVPTSKVYTSVIFTKRIQVPTNRNLDTLLFASGHIEGYKIYYFHVSDTTKYVQRWNFTVDFTNLGISH